MVDSKIALPGDVLESLITEQAQQYIQGLKNDSQKEIDGLKAELAERDRQLSVLKNNDIPSLQSELKALKALNTIENIQDIVESKGLNVSYLVIFRFSTTGYYGDYGTETHTFSESDIFDDLESAQYAIKKFYQEHENIEYKPYEIPSGTVVTHMLIPFLADLAVNLSYDSINATMSLS